MWKSLHPVINESKLKSYYHLTLSQQETSLTIIAPSQESITQEKISDFGDKEMNYNTSLSGKNNPLKNQCGRIDERLSKGGYVENYTKGDWWLPATPMPRNSIWMPEKLYNEDVDHVRPYLE